MGPIRWANAGGARRRCRRETDPMEIELLQAEALLGNDVVIGRAKTWRMSTHLCRTAGQCDPAEYWAYAVWDDTKRDWIEPTSVFRRLSDLVEHCQSKERPNTAPPETPHTPAPR